MKGRRSVDSHYAPIKIIIENGVAVAAEGVQKLEDTHIAGWKVKWLKRNSDYEIKTDKPGIIT